MILGITDGFSSSAIVDDDDDVLFGLAQMVVVTDFDRLAARFFLGLFVCVRWHVSVMRT